MPIPILKKIRLHKPLVRGILEALQSAETKKVDHVLPALLKAQPKWGSRDRNFVAENTYEVVRNKRFIQFLLGGDATPSKMLGAWLILKGLYDPEEEIFRYLDPEVIQDNARSDMPLEIRFSLPDELSQRAKRELGDDRWAKEAEAMHGQAPVYLRVNERWITRDKLVSVLLSKDIAVEPVASVPSAIKVLKRAGLNQLEEYKKGFFEIQDAGSQEIAYFLDPQAGEFIVDTCAGAGGKTLHLADLSRNKAKILALDVEEGKLEELEKRAARNRVSQVETSLWNNDILDQYRGQADAVLMDVPCSGLGVLRRNPDAKELLTEAYIDSIRDVQAEILQKYSALVRKGGRLVYATCSLLPSENEGQVKRFLENHGDFELIKDKQIWPSETDFDGFYMALLRKK